MASAPYEKFGAQTIDAMPTKDEGPSTAVATPQRKGSSSSSNSQDNHPVDVEGAKREFEALRRTLSTASSLHRVQSGQKSVEAQDDDDFDLKEYLVRFHQFLSSFLPR